MVRVGAQFLRRWSPAPETERIVAALEMVRADRDRRRDNQLAEEQNAAWLATVNELIENAERHFQAGHFQAAWHQIKAAGRGMLADPSDPDAVVIQSLILLRDAEEIAGRRGNAVKDLLCDADGKLRAELGSKRHYVIEATRLRDDHFDTQYYRLELRRRHLINVFFILIAGLMAIIALAFVGQLELFAGHERTLIAVILFGMLGGALSVAQSLAVGDVKQKTPMQLIGSFMIWLRPVVGGTAAVIAYAMLLANMHLKLFFSGAVGAEPAVAIVVAVVAGFSERFIVGAMSSISDVKARTS